MATVTPSPPHPVTLSQPRTRLVVLAQLVRLPNAFTEMADICLGGLVISAIAPGSFRWWAFALLVMAYTCLYWAGMVWNDYFDLEQDLRERPSRPLPSGY